MRANHEQSFINIHHTLLLAYFRTFLLHMQAEKDVHFALDCLHSPTFLRTVISSFTQVMKNAADKTFVLSEHRSCLKFMIQCFKNPELA